MILWMIEGALASVCLMCVVSVISMIIYFVTKPSSWWICLPIICVAGYVGLETFDMFVRTIYAN